MSESCIRTKTWIEKDEDGWYCVVGFWTNSNPADVGNDDRDSDDGIRVGPFPSRQAARRELRGDFRKIVLAAVDAFTRRNNGRVVAQAWGDVPEQTPGN